MTALAQYQRLEALALWRPHPGAQRREVVVALGDATLLITAVSEKPLSHWSLPAVIRLNPGAQPALYAPNGDADEVLEIAEPAMIAAMETVRTAIEDAGPHPGRVRFGVGAAIVIALILGVFLWLPGALMRQSGAILPDAARAELGAQVMQEVEALAGRACATPDGTRALDALSSRLFGAEAPRIVVVPRAVAGTTHIPGNVIIIDRSLVEAHEQPEVLAGHLLAEDLRRAARDPALRLLADAGLPATLRLLTAAEVDAAALHRHATRLLTEPPVPVDETALLLRFAEAQVSTLPYAYALDVTGETTLALIEADPMRGASATPVLSPRHWAALQAICGG
ncbi:MAG: hypothetical protein AAF914_08150 [Pseudomonadota bacterium]